MLCDIVQIHIRTQISREVSLLDFNIKDLIPKHKHDSEAVNRLKEIDKELIDVSPVLDDIFEWIQNINWPVAQELCEVLPDINAEILLPRIKMVLNSDDDSWQYACIKWLIPNLSRENIELIKPELERIINNPTKYEEFCGINEDAKDIFDEYF